ncbi:MAG: hypothetical protein M0R02_08875 [Bacteroidales bacterium]|jgi:hypothetical protein|nr:hypothetical protein [Bacteroidales bacterium]NLK81321.1 hypothetical protein [Bacteroidales bacterium]HPY82064.1 hypothetical protein [Bacteroidales bacterium]
MKAFILILCVTISFVLQAQEATDFADTAIVTHEKKSVSKIVIFIAFEHDSLPIDVNCRVIEHEDAIEIIAYKYKGVRIVFRRSNAFKNMMEIDLDATHTTIDIKTIFSGTYYIDVYDSEGVKRKMFRVEKDF